MRQLANQHLHLLRVRCCEHAALLKGLLRQDHDLLVLIAFGNFLLHGLLVLRRHELEVTDILELLLNLLLHVVVFLDEGVDHCQLGLHLRLCEL